jgi:hypothetical protein
VAAAIQDLFHTHEQRFFAMFTLNYFFGLKARQQKFVSKKSKQHYF